MAYAMMRFRNLRTGLTVGQPSLHMRALCCRRDCFDYSIVVWAYHVVHMNDSRIAFRVLLCCNGGVLCSSARLGVTEYLAA